MSTVPRIAKNVAFLYIAYIITSVLSILLTVVIARNLGDITFGRYSFAFAFTAIFAVFLDLGFNTLVVRDVARDKSMAPKYLGNIIIIKAILSVAIFGFISLTISLMDYPHDTTTAVLILGIYIIFTALADIFRVTFRAFERMEYEALVSVVSRLIIVSLGLAAVFLGYGLVEITLVFAIGGIFDFIFSFFLCGKKFAKPRLEIDLHFWKRAVKIALPIGFLSIAAIIYIKIDTVMLSLMKGDDVVGWYNAAYSLVLALQPIPPILMNALLPSMASFFISSRSSLEISYEKSLKYLLILGLPMAVGLALLASRIIPLFYGSEFTNSISALQILAWDVLLIFLFTPLAVVLISMDKQNQMAVVAAGCALINVILNIILIPRFSYIGAGIATLATETVLFGLYFYLVSKYLCKLPLHKIVARPMVACAIMAAFVCLFYGMNLGLLVVLAAALYFVVLYLTRGFTADDLDLLKEILRYAKTRGRTQ